MSIIYIYSQIASILIIYVQPGGGSITLVAVNATGSGNINSVAVLVPPPVVISLPWFLVPPPVEMSLLWLLIDTCFFSVSILGLIYMDHTLTIIHTYCTIIQLLGLIQQLLQLP